MTISWLLHFHAKSIYFHHSHIRQDWKLCPLPTFVPPDLHQKGRTGFSLPFISLIPPHAHNKWKGEIYHNNKLTVPGKVCLFYRSAVWRMWTSRTSREPGKGRARMGRRQEKKRETDFLVPQVVNSQLSERWPEEKREVHRYHSTANLSLILSECFLVSETEPLHLSNYGS